MLTKIQKDLANLMHSRDVDRDTCIGVTIMLETESNRKKMLSWIKKNPKAGQTEIMQKLYTFMPGVPYYTMPSIA